MLASSRFTRMTQRRKHKHKHKRMERFPFSCACAYACVVRRTCEPGRRKHKHKRKHKALMLASHWFTDKLSAYNLVTHALPFSAMFRNQISRQKAARPRDCAKFVCFCACVCHVMLMLIARVNILNCACACAYSYACVVRVNQASEFIFK